MVVESDWWCSPDRCLDFAACAEHRRQKWMAPLKCWVKFNVDASLREWPKKVGIGGVLRDDNGKLLALFSGPIECNNVEEAELEATIEALRRFKTSICCGKFGLVIESDSSSVIQWCLFPCSRPWNLLKVFGEVDDLIKSISECVFQHVVREANNIADSLAG